MTPKKKSAGKKSSIEKNTKEITKQKNILPSPEPADVIHELKVHQSELEMQNEELQRTQEELEESRAMYADLYDFAPVGYFTFDQNGMVLEANLTGASMLGVERRLLIKKPFSRFVVKEYQDDFFRHRRKALETSEKHDVEIKLRNKKDVEFFAHLESIPFRDRKGRETVRTSLIDVTQRKLAQAWLTQERKLSAMGLMAGALAHELNSPLCGIMLMMEKHKKEAEKDSRKDKELSLTLNACRYMAKVIGDFKSFYRTSNEEMHELDLNQVIEDTLSFSSTRLKIKGIHIIKEFRDKLPRVNADKTGLQQVIINMITNAGDAMPGGGHFTIATRVAKDRKNVIMEFRDTGAGIKKEHIGKLFDPLFTTKGPGEGTGLGLSVTKGIIQKHGGDMDVKSTPGKGTRFIITLPPAGP